MYQQFFDQAGTLFKPLQDLVSLNQSAFETLASKQSALASEIFNDSISFAQKIMSEKEGNFWDLHKTYWEGLNQKLNQATQDTVEYLSVTQTKITDMVQESVLSSTLADLTKNMPSVEAAIASTLKPIATTLKPTATTKVKPVQEAAKSPAVKSPAVNPIVTPELAVKPAPAKTAPAKPVQTTPAQAKPADIKAPAAAKPVESKPVAKTAPVSPAVAAPLETKPAAKTVASKPANVPSSDEKTTGKKVGGDDASVESVIRSIMAERNH